MCSLSSFPSFLSLSILFFLVWPFLSSTLVIPQIFLLLARSLLFFGSYFLVVLMYIYQIDYAQPISGMRHLVIPNHPCLSFHSRDHS